MSRKFILAAATAAALGGAPLLAHAASLSMNEVELAEGTDMEACMAAARVAIRGSGLKPEDEAPAATFGSTPNGLIAAVYCLPDRGIAMIGVAGNSSAETRPVLGVLLQLMSTK